MRWEQMSLDQSLHAETITVISIIMIGKYVLFEVSTPRKKKIILWNE